jgi:hypothetical protein
MVLVRPPADRRGDARGHHDSPWRPIGLAAAAADMGSGQGARAAPADHRADGHQSVRPAPHHARGAAVRRRGGQRPPTQEPRMGTASRPDRRCDHVGHRVTVNAADVVADVNPRRSPSGRDRPPRADLRHSPPRAPGRIDGSAGCGRASTATTTPWTSYNATARSGTESTRRPCPPATAAGTPRWSHGARQHPPRHGSGRAHARAPELDTTTGLEQHPSPANSTCQLVCRPRHGHTDRPVATLTGIRPGRATYRQARYGSPVSTAVRVRGTDGSTPSLRTPSVARTAFRRELVDPH